MKDALVQALTGKQLQPQAMSTWLLISPEVQSVKDDERRHGDIFIERPSMN